MVAPIKRHLRSSAAMLLALLVLLLVPALSPQANAQASYVRIRNKWQSSYLYQSGGVVRYGSPASGDQSSHWEILDFSGAKRLRNRATGHYMHIENLTGSVQAGLVNDAWMSARWSVSAAPTAGYSTIRNAWQTSSIIHIENLTGNAQYGAIPTTWDSPQWAFEPVTGGTTPTATRTNTTTAASATPTRTRTNTAIGPSATRTNTAIGPSPTRTRTNTTTTPGNLVANPGFETAGASNADAASWTEGSSHARASDRFHSGGWALKSSFTGGGTDTRTAPISIQPNTTYTLSAWVYKAATTGAACVDMNDLAGELQLCAGTTNVWQQLSGSWNSGPNTSLVLRLITDGTPNGAIWFDDLELRPAGVAPTATPSHTRTPAAPTATPTRTPQPATGVKGRAIAGYQGWFGAAGDGSPIGRWFHWSGSTPSPGNLTFEIYPDTREYPVLFQTNFANLGNGSPARLFSSYSTETVNLHFRWMREYNIDGAALQRFGNELADPAFKSFRDSITTKVRSAAEANGRVFYLMYDASGMGSDFVQRIQSDWTNTIIGSMNLTASPAYARESGRPVVALWGIGFTDRPGTAQDWLNLISWFKNNGAYVIGGVPRDWRAGASNVKPGFLDTFRALNMISPWTVGSYKHDVEVDGYKNNVLIPDRDFCAANGIDYQPVAFPGFAWSNWNGGPRNDFPRNQGRFFWRQAYNIKSSNISNLYIAMFDEYDEGTAIAKAAEDSSMIPTNQYFLTLDADGVRLSSDFYLRLAGAANSMIKGQAPLTPNVPIPNQ